MSCALGPDVVVGENCRGSSWRVWPILAVAGLLLSPAASALSLRLDTRLTTTPVAGSIDAATAQLIRFGVSDMQRRSLELRHTTAAVQAENHVLRERIEGTEELIAHMRDFSGVQERTIEILKSGIAWQQSVQAPVRAKESIPRSPLPSPASRPVKPLPLARTTTQAPARQEAGALSVAGVAVPNWLLGGAVGALITAVLAWLLMFVSRRRQNAAAVVEAGGEDTHSTSSRAVQTEADGLRELSNNDGGNKEHSGEQRMIPALADSTPVGSQDGASTAQAGAGTRVDDVPGDPNAGAKDWSRTMVSRKAADPQALKEVDTLIAFEEFEKAKSLLDQMLVREPDNPEYMLRHYHVRTQGGIDTTADDAEILRAMMDGPMSDTLLRVREIGRGLMPGDPLFDDNEQREEVAQVLKKTARGAILDAPDEPDFMQTIVLNPGDETLKGAQKRS